MNDQENKQAVLTFFQNLEGRPLRVDEEALNKAYESDDRHQSPAVKILSVLGGILACLAFAGFILITKLYDSQAWLLILGAACLALSLAISAGFKKRVLDTISVACFLIGLTLLGIGFSKMRLDANLQCLIFIVLSLVSLLIASNYALSFLSVLVINGSLLALIASNAAVEWIHAYVAALTVAVCCCFLNEASIVGAGKTWSKRYLPIRVGLVFSYASALLFVGKKGLLSLSADYVWLSSAAILPALLYLSSILQTRLGVASKKRRLPLLAFCFLLLLPTAFSPAIPGALLIILLGFLVNHKTSVALGILSFVYFVSQYYYDLHFTLLAKSMLLLASGILFILLYLFTSKKRTSNEKI